MFEVDINCTCSVCGAARYTVDVDGQGWLMCHRCLTVALSMIEVKTNEHSE